MQGNVHLIAGAGGNVAVQVGEDGILLVDSGTEPMSAQVLAAIRGISKGPIRYIVNTHLHADHIGGNAALASAGASLGAARALEGAEITAHENVLLRLSKPTGTSPPRPTRRGRRPLTPPRKRPSPSTTRRWC